MPGKRLKLLRPLFHRKCHQRFLPCVIFIMVVVPFLCLNFLAYQNSDNEEYVQKFRQLNNFFQGGTVRVKRRFFQHISKWNRSIILDLADLEANQSKNHFEQDFYVGEQILFEQLKTANEEYERSCARSLQRLNASLQEGNSIPEWQIKLLKCKNIAKTKFFISAALQVRIYQADKAKWTIRELKQWLHYMFWAGVEHVYICDHYRFTSERLFHELARYIDAKLVTYLAWNHIRIPMTAQVACYQYIIDKYKRDSVWQIAVDMDEYPFMPNDTKENFLRRYLKSMSFSASEISLHNYLMLGHGDRSRTMAIERITRMTPEPANDLDKPVYRPSRVLASIHHNLINHGRRFEALDEEIRLLHYWGSRINHFGPDTPDILFKTIENTALRDSLAWIVRNSLISFNELDAFCNTTGP